MKCLQIMGFAMLAVLSPFAVFAQQPTNSLEDLQKAYEQADAKITIGCEQKKKEALDTYGRTLSACLKAAQAKGDFDAYSAIDAEQKRFEAEKTAPTNSVPSISNVVGLYNATVRSATSNAVAQHSALLRKYIGALDVLLKRLTQEGRITEAKEVKERKTAMEFVLADMESKMVQPEQKLPQPVREEPATAVDGGPTGPMTVDLGEGVRLEMVWIRPGEFLMGSPAKEAERQENEGQHKVRITKGFWIGKYEITQAQWEQVMGSNPSSFKNAGKDAPVEMVSWDDCQEFIKKLNANVPGATADRSGFRFGLPTEAQWEYACRAGARTRFCSGDAESDLDKLGWYAKNSGNTTHPVGQKKANARGLYDMHGNVLEWCRDWYGDYGSGDAKDPEGPASGSECVVRGGAWRGEDFHNRSATRFSHEPGFRSKFLGLRIVCGSR